MQQLNKGRNGKAWEKCDETKSNNVLLKEYELKSIIQIFISNVVVSVSVCVLIRHFHGCMVKIVFEKGAKNERIFIKNLSNDMNWIGASLIAMLFLWLYVSFAHSKQ